MRKALIGLALLVPLALFALILSVLLRDDEAPPCGLCPWVEKGDLTAVARALEGATTVDDRAWHIVLQRLPSGSDDDIAIATLLAKGGADPNYTWRFSSTSRSGSSPAGQWAAAIVAGAIADPAAIDALIAHGLDVKGRAGAEALVGAASRGRADIVGRLLAAGVPSNAQGKWPQRSALAEAIQSRDLKTIDALERAGAVEW